MADRMEPKKLRGGDKKREKWRPISRNGERGRDLNFRQAILPPHVT